MNEFNFVSFHDLNFLWWNKWVMSFNRRDVEKAESCYLRLIKKWSSFFREFRFVVSSSIFDMHFCVNSLLIIIELTNRSVRQICTKRKMIDEKFNHLHHISILNCDDFVKFIVNLRNNDKILFNHVFFWIFVVILFNLFNH